MPGQIKISELDPSVVFGNDSLFIVVVAGITYKITGADLKAKVLESVGLEVINATTIALLENDTNWIDNKYVGSTAITGQNKGDYYINNNNDYRFMTPTTVRRIRYSDLVLKSTGAVGGSWKISVDDSGIINAQGI